MKSKMRRADKAMAKRLKKVRKNGEYHHYDDLVNLLIDSRRRESVTISYILAYDADQKDLDVNTVQVTFAVPSRVIASLTNEEWFLLSGRSLDS
ncbi:MAG TPA: hypothetical protein PKD68_00430 [Candidatus Saccharibacteria bacterium]|nr:hypothetical protein [Candidatus Saccharibacteria bacterium]